MRRAFTALACLVLTACPAGPAEPPPDVPAAGTDSGPSSLLVAAPEALLWSKAGGAGRSVATVHQGVTASIKETSGSWALISTQSPFEVTGWVRRSDLGCRVVEDTHLLPEPGGSAGGPLARAACMLRILEISDDWLHVESAPEPFTHYEKGPSYKDPVIVHTEFAGFIARGWIPSGECSTDVKAFYPRAPKDGELGIISTASPVLRQPGGISNQIPGKALPFTRWVTTTVDGTWVKGRTDGQVVVHGWVPITSVAALPNTNPLNKLAEKKLRDFEVIASTGIKNGKGQTITTLPGGQEVDKIDEGALGCKIKTMPPVIVEGWIPCTSLRNLSVLPEAAIEYGIIDGGTWPPDRGPQPNPLSLD
ncbi:MAG: hypothetical protein JRG91_04165 [Deltaproteobacteria bacterium]|nr:hypothetical protein [Deltaproteobacteria bacterium]